MDHLEVEWDDGSETIGDFTFIIGPVVLKETIADELLAVFSGFRKGEIRMPHHPNLEKPKHIRRKVKRVWLPYEGPPICFMDVTAQVDFAVGSTVTVASECTECASVIYKSFEGIESKDGAVHSPRILGKGFVFENSSLADADVFRPRHTGLTLCTDRVRDFIESRGYRNIEFLEVGDIV